MPAGDQDDKKLVVSTPKLLFLLITITNRRSYSILLKKKC